MSERSIIYHYPFRMAPQRSGSEVHLAQMLNAFRQLGYAVEMIQGSPRERAAAMRVIRDEAGRGRVFDFMYAWSPTRPTLYPRRNLLYPFLDYRFFAWCCEQGIPIGLFYGDVHWRTDYWRRQVPRYRQAYMRALHWYDWLNYRRLADHLFLPTLGIGPLLPSPWPQSRVSALWPGCNPVRPSGPAAGEAPGRLRLLYVGGIMPPLYDLKPMLDVVNSQEGVSLTLCCREAEWAQLRAYYEPFARERIQIVHAWGAELAPLYAQADLFAFYARDPYLDVAMPVKVMESIGYGLPLIVAEGTEMAGFVRGEQAGWAVATGDELARLLGRLRADRAEVDRVRAHIVQDVQERHTWQVRARTVADCMAAYVRD